MDDEKGDTLDSFVKRVELLTRHNESLTKHNLDLQAEVEQLRGANEDAEKEIATLMDGMELAWCLIANAEQDSWDRQEGDWYGAATRFRDQHWHPALDRNPRVKSELAEAVDKALEGK